MNENKKQVAEALKNEPLRIRKSIGEITDQCTENEIEALGRCLNTDFEIEFLDPCTLWLWSVREVRA